MTLSTLEFERPIRELEEKREQLLRLAQEHGIDVARELEALNARLRAIKEEVYAKLTPWQQVQLARHPARPYTLDYVQRLLTDWQELHGDRRFGDDAALVAGVGRFAGRPVVVMGHQKGRDAAERVRRNFGMPHPEGYRKALRILELADRFRLPVLAFIDTAGAYPGIGAEERHVAEAIAVNLREMFTVSVPIVAAVIGEGGSGGALGIGVADRLLMLRYSYYSVISPEGCAAILWKDRAHAPEAAAALCLTAPDLVRLGIADEVVPEPLEGAHHDYDYTAAQLRRALLGCLTELVQLPIAQLLAARHAKYRRIGQFSEGALNVPAPAPAAAEPVARVRGRRSMRHR